MKPKTIKLLCGVLAEYNKGKDLEFLDITLTDLYNANGYLNDFMLVSDLFKELQELGYQNDGLYTSEDYSGVVDGLFLNVSRKILK